MTIRTKNGLPYGREKLKEDKPYVNISKLAEGEHRFRIVQPAIGGWVEWENSKPFRYHPDNKPKYPKNADQPLRPFWALHVWDYAQQGLYAMEITQKSILGSLESLGESDEWGHITTFDFKLKKTKTNKTTKEGKPVYDYSVIPLPHNPFSSEIKEAISKTKVRLEALYEGKDPWRDLEPEFKAAEIDTNALTEEQCARLDSLLLDLTDDEADNLLDALGVDSIHHIEIKDFERVVKSIHKKVKEKTNGSAVA